MPSFFPFKCPQKHDFTFSVQFSTKMANECFLKTTIPFLKQVPTWAYSVYLPLIHTLHGYHLCVLCGYQSTRSTCSTRPNISAYSASLRLCVKTSPTSTRPQSLRSLRSLRLPIYTATIRHLNRLSSSSLSPNRLSTDTTALCHKCERQPARPSRKPSLRK